MNSPGIKVLGLGPKTLGTAQSAAPLYGAPYTPLGCGYFYGYFYLNSFIVII